MLSALTVERQEIAMLGVSRALPRLSRVMDGLEKALFYWELHLKSKSVA